MKIKPICCTPPFRNATKITLHIIAKHFLDRQGGKRRHSLNYGEAFQRWLSEKGKGRM